MQASKRALGWCVDNIYRQGDELHLLHVIPPGTYMLLAVIGPCLLLPPRRVLVGPALRRPRACADGGAAASAC
jgi:hypothetical protein